MTTELRAAIPMLQSVLQRAEAIDCQPLAAAPSGVSDAMVDSVRADIMQAAANAGHPQVVIQDEWVRFALEAMQPQPGRVDVELALWREEAALAQQDGAHPQAKSVAAKIQARVAMRLAAAPTASSQEADHE